MEPPNGLPFTNEQLKEAGLLGEEPSLFALQCLNDHKKPLSSPVSPTLSDASTPSSTLPIASNTTAVAPYELSDWERTTYYHGISRDPPKLIYRSDLLDNPFPKPVGSHHHLPTKSIHGVFGTPLNPVWRTVGPQICGILKARKICFSSIDTARFVTHGEDNKDSLGPIVIWISAPPNTATAKDAHDASQDILAILESNGVKGAVVEWCEGVVVWA
ncbi:hypothetical protein EDD15DRAFT_2301313 [Pisolithus albus]|nr:hypothetical protein EDD15DRAFT_2301313 [Pisolithus albus]